MRYCVVARHLKHSAAIELPDFDLSFEYPVDITVAALRADSRRRLLEAIQNCIDCRDPVPRPLHTPDELNEEYGSKKYRATWIKIPFPVALKIEAYIAWRESGMTEMSLVKATGMSKSGIRNMFQLDVNSEIRMVYAVLVALGKDVKFSIIARKGAKPQ